MQMKLNKQFFKMVDNLRDATAEYSEELEKETPMKTNPPLPFKVRVLGDEPVIVRNRFSGEKCELTPEACAVYDATIGASMMAETVAPEDGNHPAWEVVRKGLAWFREYYPAEYMILLD